MYKRNIDFHLIGELPEFLLEMPPLEGFSHTFGGQTPDTVLLIDAREMTIDAIMSMAEEGREMFIVADEKKCTTLMRRLAFNEHVTISSADSYDLTYNFRRWQVRWRERMEAWQTAQYLDVTINSSPSMVWYKSVDGIHEKVNDSFCRIVKKTKDQVEGQRHPYIWGVEKEGPDCIASDQEAMLSGKTCVSNETVQTGETDKVLVVYKSPLYDRDGSVMGTAGVGVDVTAERRYANELIRKSDLINTVFESIDCGMICQSLDGTEIYSINQAALDMMGYRSLEALMDAGFKDIAPCVLDGDREQLRNAIHSVKNMNDTVSINYSVRHENGEVRHLVGSARLTEWGGKAAHQCFVVDCTVQNREAKENELWQRELIHALSAEYMLVYYYDIDLDKGTFLRDSYGLESIIGDGSASLITLTEKIINCYTEEEDKEWMRVIMSVDYIREELSINPIYSVIYRARIVDNELRYYQMKVVKVETPSGGYGIVTGISNVDEKMKAEYRKNALLNESLNAAERASAAKSVFLSNMSHDIRTPMNAVIGFTNLAIRHHNDVERVDAYLSKILESGNLVLQLVNDVLDVTHIESGQMALEYSNCSIYGVIQNMYNILLVNIQEKQLQVNLDTSGVMNDVVSCDELRLSQVLINLLSNAIKYSNIGGEILLQVKELSSDQEGYSVYVFHLQDNGIGVSEEFLPHIFEPFEREHNSTLSGIQGTGLGMTIVKNIVDLMNGKISVQSELGVGTTFDVQFTFKLMESMTMDVNEARAVDTSLSRARILVVEDNELNQEIVVDTLEEVGLSAEVANNGKEAVEKLESSRPSYYSLVLMDIQMPVMNGYEAIKAIRASKREDLQKIPIFAVTANAFEEDRKNAIECGATGFIAKPLDIDNLLLTIHDILG